MLTSIITLLTATLASTLTPTTLGAKVTKVNYPSDLQLSLHFLCDPKVKAAYVRDVPWDCAGYVVCMKGMVIPGKCYSGRIFSSNHKCDWWSEVKARRCRGQIYRYITHICHENPYARIRDPQHCGQFYDCSITVSQHYVDYLMECPYPKMFSDVTKACEDYTMVDCLGRGEPTEPCDYLQYRQMYDCHGFPGHSPGCDKCRRHHPSCRGMGDGRHPVSSSLGNPLLDLTMDCHRGRTLRINQELRVDRPVTRVTKAQPEVMKPDVMKTKTQGRASSEPMMNKNVKSNVLG